jgi:hypothetical protein
MKRPELVAAFRSRIDDDAEPYLWTPADVQLYLDAAHREAAERALLIRDASTVAVCSVPIVANTASYTLHASVLSVERAKLASQRQTLTLSSTEQMDRLHPGWDDVSGAPAFLVIDPDGSALRARLVPPPAEATTLALVVNRLPLASLASDDDEPEIPARYHLGLVDWMMHLAYGKRDTETFNERNALECEARFAAQFGERIDANVRRKQADRSPARVVFREF